MSDIKMTPEMAEECFDATHDLWVASCTEVKRLEKMLELAKDRETSLWYQRERALSQWLEVSQ